jgi:hypothetical protein
VRLSFVGVEWAVREMVRRFFSIPRPPELFGKTEFPSESGCIWGHIKGK